MHESRTYNIESQVKNLIKTERPRSQQLSQGGVKDREENIYLLKLSAKVRISADSKGGSKDFCLKMLRIIISCLENEELICLPYSPLESQKL